MTVAEFFAGVRAGQLRVQRCAGCGALAVPPRVACQTCHGTAWEVAPLAGDGEVTSYTVIRVPPGRLEGQAPYAIAVVRMREGVTLLGRLLGLAPEAMRVGLPVRWTATSDPGVEPPVLAFAPPP